MNDKKNEIVELLSALVVALQTAQLWDDTAPKPEDLHSKEPFCVDKLAFEQWLQWVFIPKLSEMLAMPHFNGLPNLSDIHTMADYVFASYEQDTQRICQTIKAIDLALNRFETPSVH